MTAFPGEIGKAQRNRPGTIVTPRQYIARRDDTRQETISDGMDDAKAPSPEFQERGSAIGCEVDGGRRFIRKILGKTLSRLLRIGQPGLAAAAGEMNGGDRQRDAKYDDHDQAHGQASPPAGLLSWQQFPVERSLNTIDVYVKLLASPPWRDAA
ncbi:hypothetical protein ACIU1A_12815 [Mesorhizobium sp. ORM16]